MRSPRPREASAIYRGEPDVAKGSSPLFVVCTIIAYRHFSDLALGEFA
jgi:hypothetical protein